MVVVVVVVVVVLSLLAAWAERERCANKELFFWTYFFLLKNIGLEKNAIEAHPPQFQDPDLFLKNVLQ